MALPACKVLSLAPSHYCFHLAGGSKPILSAEEVGNAFRFLTFSVIEKEQQPYLVLFSPEHLVILFSPYPLDSRRSVRTLLCLHSVFRQH